MSSAGQIIGGALGFAVGWFFGNPMLGAAIGMGIGGAIDPPKGPEMTGPRLDDLSVQTSTYGAPLARGYGTVSVVGNLFWLEGDKLKEWTTTEEQEGGKGGGGGASTTTYHYSATFAVGLLHVPLGATVTLRRLWIDTDLVFEAGSNNTNSVIASADFGTGMLGPLLSSLWNGGFGEAIAEASSNKITFYPGSDTQLPNPRMQADKGINNVSAYPGLCYIVFEDLNLEKYSNTLMRAQVKAEIVVSAVTESSRDEVFYEWTGDTGTWGTRYAIYSTYTYPTYCKFVMLESYNWDGTPFTLVFGTNEFGAGTTRSRVSMNVPGGWGYTYRILQNCQADIDAVVTFQIPYNSYINCVKYRMIGPSGVIAVTDHYINMVGASTVVNENPLALWDGSGYCVLDRGSIFITTSNRLQEISIYTGPFRETPTYSWTGWIGASENYLFFTTEKNQGAYGWKIRRFLRTDMSIHESYITGNNICPDNFYVLDDNTIFANYRSKIIKHTFVGGTWIEEKQFTGLDLNSYSPQAFGVYNEEPLYAVSCIQSINSGFRWYLNHIVVNNTPSKLRTIVTSECNLAGIATGDLDLTSLTNSDVRGYKIPGRMSARSALEPLQAAFPFDVASSGYKLKFVSRGGSSVATIPSSDLGTIQDSGETGTLLPVAREMETQLPYRVNVKYTDPSRDYDIGEQYAERPTTDSVHERSIELALSLTADEATKVADILLEKEWVERVALGPFILPPTWSRLEAADIVIIEHKGRQYETRLTRVEYLPDGRVQCDAKLTSSASYVSTAQGADPLVVPIQTVPLLGSTEYVLLDIPYIRPEQSFLGQGFGLLGVSPDWPGGTLLKSEDSGNSYQSVGSSLSRVRLFNASNALSAHNGILIDSTSQLTVTPRYPGHSLSSITLEQLFAKTNLAAYGKDGRWEIIAFATVTPSGGTFIIKDFTRSMYGTEVQSGQHQADDQLIMLDSGTIGFFNLPATALGSAKLYRAVTQGKNIDSANDFSDTYEAINMKPAPVVYLNGYRSHPAFDWVLDWKYVSKTPVEAFSGFVNPQVEATESYDIDIFSNDTYSKIVRTFYNIPTASITYTIDQQKADFSGAGQKTLYLDIYQNNATVGRGRRSRLSIQRDALVNGQFYGATLLSLGPLSYHKGDEVSGNLIDSSGNNYTAVVTGTLTYQQTSLLSGGTTGKSIKATGAQYAQIPYNAAFNGAHTVTAIIKVESFATSSTIFATGAEIGYTTEQGLRYIVGSDGLLYCQYTNIYGGGAWYSIGPANFATLNEVIHFTAIWDGGINIRVYKNGVQWGAITTYGNSVPYNTTQGKSWFARPNGSSYANGLVMDEMAFFNRVLTDNEILSLYGAM